jgi:hypothetical protein
MNTAKRLVTFVLAAVLAAANIASAQLIPVQSLDTSVNNILAAGLTHGTSRVGTSTASATSVVCPAHQPGDAIVIVAVRGGSTTAPTLPSGYLSILSQSNSTATTVSMIVGYKIASATNDSSGTWTNASQVICAVYRPPSGYTVVIGQFASNSSTTTTVNYPALSPMGDSTTGLSWVVGAVGAGNTTQTIATAPSGMTNVTSIVGASSEAALQDTNAGVTSWSSTNATITGTGSTVSGAFEIAMALAGGGIYSTNVYQHIGGGGELSSRAQSSTTWKIPISMKTGTGNCMVLALSFTGGTTVSSVSGAVNGSLGSAVSTSIQGTGNVDSAVYVLPNITSGNETITVTFATAVSMFQYVYTEFYGVATSSVTAGSVSNGATQTTTPATGSFTPTNNDGTGGNIIWAYHVKSDVTPGQHTITMFPASGFTPLTLDTFWIDSDGFSKAAQAEIQATSAAINPAIVAIGVTTDHWNSIAVALKISSGSGTAPPTGIQMGKIDHFSTGSYPSSGTVKAQVTSFGNLRVICSDDPSLNATTVTDSEGNTWIPDGVTAGFWYLPNATANARLTVFITGGSGDTFLSWRAPDIYNASAHPFDSATLSGQSTGGTTFTASPSPSPTSSAGLTIANIGLGQGPGLSVTAPSGAIWDLATFTGETDTDSMENADIMAHFSYSSSGAQTWTFTVANSTTTSGGFVSFH